MEGIKIEGVRGLKVTPVASSGIAPFEVIGEVGYKDFKEDGRIYYCKGSSYPEAIVKLLPQTSFNIPITISNNTKVTFYRYRTALVRDVFAEFSRDDASQLEKRLSELAGVLPDNHTAYAVSNRDFATIYVSFSDFKVRVGTMIEQVDW